MDAIPWIYDHEGIKRRLGYKAPDPAALLLRASARNIQTLRVAAGLPALIPQSSWAPVDYVTGYPTELIVNQGSLGACVAFSDIGAGARMRYVRRGEILIPSAFFVYDQINGGTDNGANIRDSLTVMLDTGAPPLSSYTHCIFQAGKNPTGVPYYKEDVAVTLTTSAECATAILMGMFPQIPILVTNSFGTFNANGVAWNGTAPRGGQSNHSVYLAGLRQIAGVWYFIMVNSWGVSWGPWNNGACLIPFAAVDNPATTDDAWAHADTPSPVDDAPKIAA